MYMYVLLTLQVGGPSQQQASVYEEFARCLPGFLPSTSASTSAATSSLTAGTGPGKVREQPASTPSL